MELDHPARPGIVGAVEKQQLDREGVARSSRPSQCASGSFSFPRRVRFLAARHPPLASRLLDIFMRAVFV
jgi:hypothetical protein